MADTLTGIGVSLGIAHAPVVRVTEAPGYDQSEQPSTDIESDGERIRQALLGVSEDLKAFAEDSPEESKKILQTTASLAKDKGLAKASIKQLKSHGVTASVHLAVEEYAAKFMRLGGYFAERVTDLYDVRDRVIAKLLGQSAPGIPELSEPAILVARDLSPADTATMDVNKVLGIIMREGGVTSHAAILCAQLGIPAIVHVTDADRLEDGQMVAIDGNAGVVFVEPDEAAVSELESFAAAREDMINQFSGAGATSDGHHVGLLANIGTVSDAVFAGQNEDVEGIGLFRTEFMFLGKASAPTLEEQTKEYTRVLRAMGDRKVVVRTLDAGADKPLAFASTREEENPALGQRGLRLSMVREDLIDTQLQALAAADSQTDADLWVMAPMVSTVEEARWFADHARAAGLKCVGIMIEVPAAALRAKKLAKVVDFFSIGSNDLAQYTMAADRTDAVHAQLLNPWQPAVLDLFAAAGEADVPVGVCGEAGGDPLLAVVLVGLGVATLSMAPRKIPAVRAALALHSLEDCQRIARAARDADTADEARAAALAAANPTLRSIVA
ncbi:phosphoenolpyruvate--protein phosphotransferase [Corynebacterium belfantii]|uniref:phosphoenolpyruvate--protein phosphotransferase n=1 Tax=Corynebacterium belfantii TaxID=2014537 RepID=UPI001F197F7F|nr:phosphoenolpyruvate--protein phosphotransferase [Corynebacterium belfantii]